MERTIESTLLHTMRIRLLEDFPSQIAACLDVLTEQQLWWRPDDRTNAVGNLVLHLAGSNRYYLDEIIGGRAGRRDRDAEFAARGGASKEEVRRTWDDAVGASAAILNGLDASQLAQETDRTGKKTTVAQILLHVSHHNAAHTGQIVWVTKMLQPGVLDDIGRKTRKK